jgi:hypothetical protein
VSSENVTQSNVFVVRPKLTWPAATFSLMGTVVQIAKVLAPAPPVLTVFGVLSYWSDRNKLAEGKLQQFANMESALRAGQAAAKRAPAVRVFRIRGNPEADYWEEMVTVAKFGDRASELGLR